MGEGKVCENYYYCQKFQRQPSAAEPASSADRKARENTFTFYFTVDADDALKMMSGRVR